LGRRSTAVTAASPPALPASGGSAVPGGSVAAGDNFTAAGWRAFASGVRDGEFDH